MTKIPKFRKSIRISKWMNDNGHHERIPEAEHLFFNTTESPREILKSLIAYSCMANYWDSEDKIPLPEELENLMHEKAKACIPETESPYDPHVHELFHYCKRNPEKAQKFIDLFEGKCGRLVQWAQFTKKRLPQHLEDSLSDPEELLTYAKEVIRGRLPEHLENVFFKDVHLATEYAFDVIRGFAPVRLPDALHNFVLMQSYAEPDDHSIKTYIKAAENNPNKTGNSPRHGDKE